MYLWLWGKEKVLTDITCAKPSEQNQRVELLDDFNREKNRGLEISRPEMFWKSILIWRKELAIVIDLRTNIHFHATIDIILTRFRSGTIYVVRTNEVQKYRDGGSFPKNRNWQRVCSIEDRLDI